MHCSSHGRYAPGQQCARRRSRQTGTNEGLGGRTTSVQFHRKMRHRAIRSALAVGNGRAAVHAECPLSGERPTGKFEPCETLGEPYLATEGGPKPTSGASASGQPAGAGIQAAVGGPTRTLGASSFW